MTVLGTRYFGGMFPQIAPELLTERQATVATNTKLIGGDLMPWKTPLLVSGPNIGSATTRTIYRYNQSAISDTNYWFAFDTICSVVKGPVVDDTEERTYWTDGTYPKKTKSNIAIVTPPYPTSSLRMGMPRPNFTPVASVSGVATDPASTLLTSIYVCTYVSSWGEEGAPSPPSNAVSWRAGQTVTITMPNGVYWKDDAGGSQTGGPYDITNVRVYRSATGTQTSTYLYLTQLALATASTTDTVPDSGLGSQIITTLWDRPPDTMIGLTLMGNQIMAGFTGTTLCLSEPGVPYAWPGAYRLSMPSTIVGIAAFDQTLVVGMTRGIMLVTGIDPANMTMAPLNEGESCVSMRSMIEMNGGVVWASPNGLWFVNGAGAINLTKLVFTHDEFQALNPASFEAYELDGRYYAAYNNGTAGTLIFEPSGQEPVYVLTDQVFNAAYHEKNTDTLFLAQGHTLYKWDKGTALTYAYRLKTWRTPGWVPMAFGKVEADAYPVTFKLFADGAQRGNQITVHNNAIFPLPPGRAYSYSFQLGGTNRIVGAAIASTAEELGRW